MIDFIGGAPNEPKFDLGLSKISPKDYGLEHRVYADETKM